MPKVAEETAYYFNGKVPGLLLIRNGVRFPAAGTWMHVASATADPEQVEEMLRDVFPTLQGKAILSATLTSDSDVEEFERSLPKPG